MSASIDVMNIEGEKSGAIDLPAQLFETNPSEYAVYRAVVAYEAHQRQGTASTKTRSEVQRSGRKHHRQKGTGQARRGTAATNLLRGGGVAFGPKPRDYTSRLNKQLKKKALSSALSMKEKDAQVKVVEDFDFPQPSTKSFVSLLKAAGLSDQTVLFVTPKSQPTVVKSCRNIPGIVIRPVENVSTYDVIAADVVLLTKSAVSALAEVHSQS